VSVQERVGAGVVTLAAGADWGAGVTPLVVQRKRPEVTEQDECSATHPTVIVVVKLTRTDLLDAYAVLRTYTVGLAVAVPTGVVLGNTATMADWLDRLGSTVHDTGTVPGVPESNEIKPTARVPWDSAALDRNFEWGVLAFDVEAVEPRRP
jgi:hypothetical protein